MSDFDVKWLDRAWLDRLIADRPCRFTSADDLQRLHNVVSKITEIAIRNSAGAPPNAEQRRAVRKSIEQLRLKFASLTSSLEAIDFGFRPHNIIEQLAGPNFVSTLNDLDSWIASDEELAPKRGNSRDSWEHSLICQMIGFYDLAFGIEWKLVSRMVRGTKSDKRKKKQTAIFIVDTGEVAQFFFEYVDTVRLLLRTHGLPNERRWYFQSAKAVQDRIARIHSNDVNICAAPTWLLEARDTFTRQTISLAELYWLEFDGAALGQLSSGLNSADRNI